MQNIGDQKLCFRNVIEPSVLAGVRDGEGINVDAERLARAKTPSGQRENAGAGADVEQTPAWWKTACDFFQKPERHCSRRVFAGAESARGRDDEVSLVVGFRRIS